MNNSATLRASRVRALTDVQASALVAAIFVVVNICMAFFQKPMTIVTNVGWDIESYIAIVQQLDAGQPLHHAAPFVYRFAAGLLASLIPFGSIYLRYLIIGVIANAATTALFVSWLRTRGIKPWGIVIAAVLLLTTWHSPIRAVYYASQGPDPLFLTVITAALIQLDRLRKSSSPWSVVSFSIFIIAATCVRETSLLFGVAALFIHGPIRRVAFSSFAFRIAPPKFWQYIPLACGVACLLIIRSTITQNNDYDFANAALIWLYNKPFIMYLQGLLLSFGPILLLLFFYWRQVRAVIAHDQHLAFLLFIIFALAWFGGTDTERIAYWAAPLVYMLIATILRDRTELRSAVVIILLLAGQILVQRLFWTTPDMIAPNPFHYPILAVQGNDVQHPHLRAWHNDRAITVISAMQLAVYSCMLFLAVNRAKLKRATY